MTNILSELEQDPFEAEEFVERLAWRSTGGHGDGEAFDPDVLHGAFEQAICDLHGLYEAMQKKCERLEIICREEERRHWQKVDELTEQNKEAFGVYRELDERIDFVATKVVHLGEQLDSVNIPRARAVEAQNLMQLFDDFMKPTPPNTAVFTDPNRLHEAADVILKLHLIAQELPSGDKENKVFFDARKNIATMYDRIEKALIEEFVRAHGERNKEKMKEVALILSPFKGYNECVDTYIEQSQMGALSDSNIFADILPLCDGNQKIIHEVFTNPDQVMAKFVLNIYKGKLLEYIDGKLFDKSNVDTYLRTLHELYSQTQKLSSQLAVFNMGSDAAFLNKLTANIFTKRLDSYINEEMACLKKKCAFILQRYYDSKNHQKKTIPSGGMVEFRREIQAKILNRTNFLPTNENYGSETFLSEEVAINLLQENKLALQRCRVLSHSSDQPVNAVMIFDILLHSLCVEHIDYSLELALFAIPLAEPKSTPEMNFFDVVRQCNSMCHLVEKQFIDTVVPMVISTPQHGNCLQNKKMITEQLEIKLHTGLERSISAIVGWAKYLLQSEQKKTDFKPESATTPPYDNATPACLKVAKFTNNYVDKIRDALDGKNVEAVLMELGIRFHRTVLDHLTQYQYNVPGAMMVICDVNHYRKCAQEFRIPLLNTLFDTLHTLCNLLVVDAEKLNQFSNGGQLAGLDRSLIIQFVQLRDDCKKEKLTNQFK